MRLVVKIGSNILTDAKLGLNQRRIASIASNISKLREMGHEVIIVSSGAVAAGMKKLGLKSMPRDVMLKQASAAVGQSSLIWTYERSFNEHDNKVAQVLLTRDGLADRKMYINAKNTMTTLLSYGVIPIVNENDTVATDEIKFGDNDQLAALVASLVEADRLIILSDVDGLYDMDPSSSDKKSIKASLVESVEKITDAVMCFAGGCNSTVGTGGMHSKLLAAEKATRSGITVNIINGTRPALLVSLMKGKKCGTEFAPQKAKLTARKGWIAFGSRTKGSITLDKGATVALTSKGKSLLPSGIVAVTGNFNIGDAIAIIDGDDVKIAKGLTNYSSDEVRKIMGLKSKQIEKTLGYCYSDEVIHRDNFVLSK